MFDKELRNYPEFGTLVQWLERLADIQELDVLKESKRGKIEDIRYVAGRREMCVEILHALQKG